MEFLRRRRTEAVGAAGSVADRDRCQSPANTTWAGEPIAGLIHGYPPARTEAAPVSSGGSAIERLRRGADAGEGQRWRWGSSRSIEPASVIRRIPAGITGERTVRVLRGAYVGAVGTIYNWYESSGKYDVGFDSSPGQDLKELDYFLPDDLEFVDTEQATQADVSSKQEITDSSSGSSAEDTTADHSSTQRRFRKGQWLQLIVEVNGRKMGTRFQVEESIDSENRVEVMNDDKHPYGGSYGYDQVEPVSNASPGTVTSLPSPQDPALLPALSEVKDGNRLFREHPDAKSMEAAVKSHGFTIEFNVNTADQHTQVIRFQEPGRSAVGRRVIEIGPKTTYSDVEHEFTHVRQQTRWSKTPGVGYLPTKTEQVTAGTLVEGQANFEDREMDNFTERSLGEVEAYGQEIIRLYDRGEMKTGSLSLHELAKSRFLLYLGDYIALENRDAAEAKANFTLTSDGQRKLFPEVEATTRTALLIVGKLLGQDFEIPKDVLDRRG